MNIEKFAEIVNKGFTEMQKHIDTRIDEVQNVQKNMLEELNATHEDVRYLKNTVSKMVHNDIAQDAAIENIKTRVHRVEKKIGLV